MKNYLESLNSCSKYICVLPIVVSELKFSNVKTQIFLADFMECSDNATLQDRPKTFNRIGMNRANDMLADSVIDGLTRETMFPVSDSRDKHRCREG